ncbi:MAG: ABC-type multidrug transport system fused ATPase/permease subunit [Verrucomicrobiales bacterium]|jgi:ABC-type multidrug transport system fused ATPase/permease subunit
MVNAVGPIGALIELVKRLEPQQRRLLFLGQLCIIASVVLELLIPQQIQRIIDDGIRNEDVGVIVATSGLMLAFTVGSAAFAICAAWIGSKVTTQAAHALRMSVYERVTELSFGDLDRFKTGPLLVRLTSDIAIVRNGFLVGASMIIRAPVMLIGAVGLVAFETPQLLLPTVFVVGAMSLLILVVVPSLTPLYAAQQNRLDRLNTVLQENLAGVQVVKNFVRQPLEIERYTERNDDLYTASMRPARRAAILEPSFLTMLYLAIAGALILTGRSATTFLTAGELATFFNYLLTAMLPIAFLGFVLPELGRMATSLERFRDIENAQPDVLESSDPTLLDHLDGSVEFDHVTMHYLDSSGQPSGDPVLEDVSFRIEAGETVVLLGSTGSGKTSLISCIPRFYDVSSGSVRLDGHDVRDLRLQDIRSNVAVALQEASIFTGSIEQNIAMGSADATREQIIEAAKAADASAFIDSLDRGYEAGMNEKGNNLSGGQRQRVALARALVSDPSILILDDTTSAVDVATEARIQERLAEQFADITVIMVAQRVSAALSADRILLLDNGRLVGNGTHDQLLASNELYRTIVESQLGPLDEVEALLGDRP